MSSIVVKNLKKNMGPEKTLEIKQLNIESPNIIGLLGPNGAGKSTILKLLSGSVEFFDGEIEINGINIRDEKKNAVKRIGSLIENPRFYQFVSGSHLLNFIDSIRRGSDVGIKVEVKSVLDETGLVKKGNALINTYSTGELKRLSLGAAIIGNPDIVLLDEPLDNLDILGEVVLDNIINKISNGKNKILVMASHDLGLLEKFCNKVIILIDGKIEEIVAMDHFGNKKIITLSRDVQSNLSLSKEYEVLGNEIIVDLGENEEIISLIRELNSQDYKVKKINDYSILKRKYLDILNIKGMSIPH
jgi:ABC-2 type transport system ATP-binding protein